jgi:hypothetical protein
MTKEQMAGWSMECRLEFWSEHRRLYRCNPDYRARWHTAHAKSAIPLRVRQSLARFGFSPDCQHVVRIKTGGGYRCQECGAQENQ